MIPRPTFLDDFFPLLVLAAFIAPVLGVVAPLGLVAVAVVTGCVGFYGIARRGLPPTPDWRPCWPLAALAAWAATSALWAPDPALALSSAARGLALAFFGLAAMAAFGRVPAGRRRLLCHAALAGLVAAAAILTVEYLTGNGISAWQAHLKGVPPMPSGAKSQLNRGATVMALLVWPAMAGADRRRVATWLALAVVAATMLIGDSLAARLAMLAGGVFFALTFWLPRLGTILLAAFLVAASLASPVALNRLPSPPASFTELPWLPLSAHHRLAIWHFTADSIAQHPWRGWGMEASRALPGGDEEIFIDRVVGGSSQGAITGPRMPLHPHNAFLQWRLELGLPGALAMAVLLWTLCRRLGRSASAPLTRAAGAATVAAAMVVSSVSYGFWQNWWQAALWLAAALWLSAATKKEGPA